MSNIYEFFADLRNKGDAVAEATVTPLGQQVYNGVSWDRRRGNSGAAYARTPPSNAGPVNVAPAAGVATQLRPYNASRRRLLVRNNHATETIYIGNNNTVTAATGYPLAAGAELRLDEMIGEVWSIQASAGDVRMLEVTYTINNDGW